MSCTGGVTLDSDFGPALKQWAAKMGAPAEWLSRIFYLESGLNPHCGNAQGFLGLNQIASKTLVNQFHVDPATYLSWTASQQLNQVVGTWYTDTLNTYLGHAPRSPGVLYALNLAPGRVKTRGDAPGTVLYDTSDGAAYTLNKGLDVDGNGAITISDLDAFLARKANETPYKNALASLNLSTASPPSAGPVSVSPVWIAIGILGVSGAVAWWMMKGRA